MEPADKASLELLLKEVERQIQFLSQNRPRQLKSGFEAVHTEALDDDQYYVETLAKFKSFILACVANETHSGVIWKPPPRHPPTTHGSFWGKFLHLAEPSSDFIHPARMLEKLDTLRDLCERSLPDEEVSSTEDIWADGRIQGWIISGQPPSLYLQEPPQRFSRLQKFGIELVRHLEKHIPVIHMLAGRRMHGESLSPVFMTKQLVYQAVFHLPTVLQLSNLLLILSWLRTAKNDSGWFETLEEVCVKLGKAQLALIIEITDVPPTMIAHFKNWPSDLEKLSNRLKERCGLQLHTLFLWPRFRLDGPSPETLSGRVVEVRDTSRLGYVAPRLPSLRQPRPIPLPVSQQFGMAEAPMVSDDAARVQTKGPGVSFGNESVSSSTPLQSNPIMSNYGSKPLEDAASTVKDTEATKDREHIKLAIVCALPLEADAVHALFDDYWEDLEPSDMRSPGDTNAYSFGVFGRFPTVLVHMPGMGKTSASIVATNCRNSFPNLKLALVVGICGGVPFTDKGKIEIILGDVIISEGLVPYDYGRQFPDRFLRKNSASDVFGRPPTELRGLLNMLKGRRGRQRLLQRTISHLQTLKRELGSEVDYLGAEQDHLYQGAYMHRHHNPDICRIMKSGEHRDIIAKDEDVIAFEMEGAGVWDMFPCLVIKAVCDYADSHKQKKWQNYAAGTAAACTKALIQEWYL
ncbi:hypothetical protein CcaCcLH18_12043 [Colletotrichum camelliae]|nr:hypothetical protein CcaCcLH18_12043 [Colletotrichum camelliae]